MTDTSVFNPCFNGFFFSIFQTKGTVSQRLFIFNPCFNGFFFSICYCCGYGLAGCKFSILVLMDSSFQYEDSTGLVWGYRFSILVLMDSSFQSNWLTLITPPIGVFNPCFNGFFFSILYITNKEQIKDRFSILVLMDSSFQSLLANLQIQKMLVFQSLF